MTTENTGQDKASDPQDSNPYAYMMGEPGPDGDTGTDFRGDEAISDDQIDGLHDEIDKMLAEQSNTKDDALDTSLNLLPASILSALRKRMPREAIERFASFMPVVDDAGNKAIIKQHAIRVHSVVVDYLADKIFGSRLSFEILDHRITYQGAKQMAPEEGGAKAGMFQVVAGAKVKCSVLRNDGSVWVKEDYASMAGTVPQDVNPARAFRIAEMGCVTAARRRALQQFGRVFGGWDVRDFENLIGSIQEKQKHQAEARKKADQERKDQKAAAPQEPKQTQIAKPALTVDPQIEQTNNRDSTPAKPVGDLARRPALVKKNVVAPGTGFELRSKPDAETIVIMNPEIFANKMKSLIKKTTSVEAANELLAINRETLKKFEHGVNVALFESITNLHEVQIALFKTREEKAQKAADKAAAKTAKTAKAAKTKQGKAAVDEAVSQAKQNAQAKAGEVEPKAVNLAEIEDIAGFGGLSRPAEVSVAEASVEAVASTWEPSLVELVYNEAENKVENLQPYATAAVNAIRSAPTTADLERLMTQLKTDYARLPTISSNFLTVASERRRKDLEK